MIFTFGVWEEFCKKLSDNGKHSMTAESVFDITDTEHYLVLKHDVETDVANALKIAEIEHKYGHRASYYVQSYLLDKPESLELLKKIKNLGHEVSYHYDVMDSSKGNIEKAIIEFEENKQKFEIAGFKLKTVCQHGNPVVERIGYTSNRDFFRSQEVQKKYSEMADIMVDFKNKANTDYVYFSDAGRCFNLIFDPINNDIVKSDDKNIPFENLDKLYSYIEQNNTENFIISTHPHRWLASKIKYVIKSIIFKCVRFVAKLFMKIPIFKRVMSRYYYLAKKL